MVKEHTKSISLSLRTYCSESVARKAKKERSNSGGERRTNSAPQEYEARPRKAPLNSRAIIEEEESEPFGLDQFATRIHLGKPSGFIFDEVLDPVMEELLSCAERKDAEGAKQLIEATVAKHPEAFVKVEPSGRLLWKILRAEPPTGKTPYSKDEHIQAAEYLIDNLARGERAGYLWGVFVDALNRSDFVPRADRVWQRIEELIDSDRKEEFEEDMLFLLTARMAGLIDSFRFELVEPILRRLVDTTGPDTAAWAFSRCLSKYKMVHASRIVVLPYWMGNDLSEFLPLRAAHIAPMMADVGAVAAARDFWIRDHTSLYANHCGRMPSDLQEARLEMEHLRAGILVFARYPLLKAPHDQLLEIIVDRFEQVIRAFPDQVSHNHGFLYDLARTEFYALCNRIAALFMSLGSSPIIIGACMTDMSFKLGFRGVKYWMEKRGMSPAFTAADRFSRWIIRARVGTVAEVLRFRLPKLLKVPFPRLAEADIILRKRYQIGIEHPELFDQISNRTQEDSEMAELEAENVSEEQKEANDYKKEGKNDGAPNGHDEPKHLPAMQQKISEVFVCRDQLAPISFEELKSWDALVAEIAETNMTGNDLYSLHRLILEHTISGKYDEIEYILLSSYRTQLARQDIGCAFMLDFYTEMRLWNRLASFAPKIARRWPKKPFSLIIGEARLIGLHYRMKKLDAPLRAHMCILKICNDARVQSHYIGHLINRARDYKNATTALDIASHFDTVPPGDLVAADALLRHCVALHKVLHDKGQWDAAEKLIIWQDAARRVLHKNPRNVY